MYTHTHTHTHTHKYIYKIDDQQGLLNSTENYTQYFAITNNGKESEKNIYVMNHCATYMKLAEHCKSTILE